MNPDTNKGVGMNKQEIMKFIKDMVLSEYYDEEELEQRIDEYTIEVKCENE